MIRVYNRNALFHWIDGEDLISQKGNPLFEAVNDYSIVTKFTSAIHAQVAHEMMRGWIKDGTNPFESYRTVATNCGISPEQILEIYVDFAAANLIGYHDPIPVSEFELLAQHFVHRYGADVLKGLL